jgi:hypothetical protein
MPVLRHTPLQATRPYDQVTEQREITPYPWVHPDEDR